MKQLSYSLSCVLLSGTILCGCTRSHYRPTVEEVLQHNPALEQVLEHCKDDSLKTLAAEYLLKNLPYYHSYSEEDMEAYLKVDV